MDWILFFLTWTSWGLSGVSMNSKWTILATFSQCWRPTCCQLQIMYSIIFFHLSTWSFSHSIHCTLQPDRPCQWRWWLSISSWRWRISIGFCSKGSQFSGFLSFLAGHGGGIPSSSILSMFLYSNLKTHLLLQWTKNFILSSMCYIPKDVTWYIVFVSSWCYNGMSMVYKQHLCVEWGRLDEMSPFPKNLGTAGLCPLIRWDSHTVTSKSYTVSESL